MRLKVRPGDFRVFEELEFTSDPSGCFHVHRLIKEKMTTSEALDRIARAAAVPRTAIAYAGMKDRQAITQQYISIEGEHVDIREHDLKVKFIGKSATKIDSKQSSGNRFQIVVRDVSLFDIARLRRNRAAVEATGLPNYFDDQRFGNLSQGQGFVFEALAKGDAERALRWLIATPPEHDRGGDSKLRGLLERNWGDWEACRSIARGPMYDRIFGVLVERPGDFVAALDAVPTRLKVIHMFAFQSYLWNVAVSRWVRQHDGGRDRLDVPSLCGPLTCWKYPNESLAAALRSREFPLVDHATVYEDRDFGEIMAELLAQRGLQQSQLLVRDVSGMRLQEELRALAIRPRDLEVLGPWPDDENEGRLKVELRFSLPRGSYATLVVKRLFADPARRRLDSDKGRAREQGFEGRERKRFDGGHGRRPDERAYARPTRNRDDGWRGRDGDRGRGDHRERGDRQRQGDRDPRRSDRDGPGRRDQGGRGERGGYRDSGERGSYQDRGERGGNRDRGERGGYRDRGERRDYGDRRERGEYRDRAERRDSRESRDRGDYRDRAERRDYRDRGGRTGSGDPRERQDHRDHRENRGSKGGGWRDRRDTREGQDRRDARPRRDGWDSRDRGRQGADGGRGGQFSRDRAGSGDRRRDWNADRSHASDRGERPDHRKPEQRHDREEPRPRPERPARPAAPKPGESGASSALPLRPRPRRTVIRRLQEPNPGAQKSRSAAKEENGGE
ncbi:MAG: tRNA pseudouridine(13) synthase TruD [Planctomycetes bacterium]|nr:tRNA pseudouridine(13) synthase TruD [Planctomycetota bacterium]